MRVIFEGVLLVSVFATSLSAFAESSLTSHAYEISNMNPAPPSKKDAEPRREFMYWQLVDPVSGVSDDEPSWSLNVDNRPDRWRPVRLRRREGDINDIVKDKVKEQFKPGPVQRFGPFPDASSTGVQPGTTLKQAGNMTVTTPGAVIEGLEIHGTLRIEADNVTVRNCKIVGDSWHSILIPDGNTGVVVENCDIIGGTNGISGTGTFRNNDISKVDNGINVYGPSRIEGNYIHDLGWDPVNGHYDGIEINGGGGTTIQHNTIINDHNQTSAVMVNNEFGSGSHIVVSDNYLAGGGYTVYLDNNKDPAHPITDMQVTNNVMGRGYWGYYYQTDNNMILSGNQEIGTTWRRPRPAGQ